MSMEHFYANDLSTPPFFQFDTGISLPDVASADITRATDFTHPAGTPLNFGKRRAKIGSKLVQHSSMGRSGLERAGFRQAIYQASLAATQRIGAQLSSPGALSTNGTSVASKEDTTSPLLPTPTSSTSNATSPATPPSPHSPQIPPLNTATLDKFQTSHTNPESPSRPVVRLVPLGADNHHRPLDELMGRSRLAIRAVAQAKTRLASALKRQSDIATQLEVAREATRTSRKVCIDKAGEARELRESLSFSAQLHPDPYNSKRTPIPVFRDTAGKFSIDPARNPLSVQEQVLWYAEEALRVAERREMEVLEEWDRHTRDVERQEAQVERRRRDVEKLMAEIEAEIQRQREQKVKTWESRACDDPTAPVVEKLNRLDPNIATAAEPIGTAPSS
ncbi:hypothetical protein M427DRAFT_131278 [Gonapodya prolifera JEL478]|uniref:Uncharacterized protein n=1 Tax=Gonapodya prolifera (strain JEL478) TaxID=1344416 RepID=A0A139AUU1_GONPJ|nr:hypothetical protein M427DRAFT_131278 [Gonapodya prolifera JEL478]|eukprot:KXS20469.1 hypothetical protein M427DRAFT_131278 [Gonapodya prolifera JEL478]